MKVRISTWNGTHMRVVKEQRIHTVEDVVNEIGWMDSNGIHGDFELLCENKVEREFLEAMKNESYM